MLLIIDYLPGLKGGGGGISVRGRPSPFIPSTLKVRAMSSMKAFLYLIQCVYLLGIGISSSTAVGRVRIGLASS